MTAPSIVIADQSLGLDEALERLARYRPHTSERYDYPGPGEPSVITADEIARTRAVSSRISVAQGDWFIELAQTAPWTPTSGDLREADPGQASGLYDEMLDLYGHFAGQAPKGVSIAKISKVLHLKRPTQFPILDSRLLRTYRSSATQAAATHSDRAFKRMYWEAIRLDLVHSTDGLVELRNRMAAHPTAKVQALQAVSDLRLLDMLTW